MSTTAYRRLTVLLLVLLLGSLVLAGRFHAKFQDERLQQRDLWLVIRDFDRIRDSALRADPEEATKTLAFFTSIGPRPDTSPGSLIFEHEKQAAVRGIIVYLRQKTGEDLGEDPQKWIAKYQK